MRVGSGGLAAPLLSGCSAAPALPRLTNPDALPTPSLGFQGGPTPEQDGLSLNVGD